MVPISGESYRRDSIQLKVTHSLKSGVFFQKSFSGGCSEEETPVPIPNTAVKLLSADGTAWVTVWESRSPPGIISYRSSIHFLEDGFEV